jgi:predicted ArsR family transcriptional regulator
MSLAEEFLKADKTKIRIIEYLKDEKWHSYYDLQRTLGINYDAIKQHLRFLERMEIVELSLIEPNESSSGKGSYKVKITKKGQALV